jgi:hypothetical protein
MCNMSLPNTFDMNTFYIRELNLYKCSPFHIGSFEKFHELFEKCSKYIESKKNSKFYFFKCELEENNLAPQILELFGIKKKIAIYLCYTNLSKKCKATKN